MSRIIRAYEPLSNSWEHLYFNSGTIDYLSSKEDLDFFCSLKHKELLGDKLRVKYFVFSWPLLVVDLLSKRKGELHILSLSTRILIFIAIFLMLSRTKSVIFLYVHSLPKFEEDRPLTYKIIFSLLWFSKRKIKFISQVDGWKPPSFLQVIQRLHPIISDNISSADTSSRAVFFIGSPRAEKNVEGFFKASQSLKYKVKSCYFRIEGCELVTPKRFLSEVIGKKSIVFVDFDSQHYKNISSGILFEAIGTGSWIISNDEFLKCQGVYKLVRKKIEFRKRVFLYKINSF